MDKNTTSEQLSLYKDIYEQTNNVKLDLENQEDRQRLASFVLDQRKKVSAIIANNTEQTHGKYINKNGKQKIDWIEFLASQREYLGLPKYIPYEQYNKYIQYILTNKENIDFSKTMKLLSNKTFGKTKGEVSDNMLHLMLNGGGSEFHAISEVISNAIDATNPQNVVGRFGKGFFQVLRFLQNSKNQVIVDSKKDGYQEYKINLQNEVDENNTKELQVGSMISDKTYIGTTVEVQTKLTPELQEQLKQYIHSKYRTNKYVKLMINGEQTNTLGEYVYVNGKELTPPTKEVNVIITDDGIKVIDNGVGMSSEELATKLLIPNDTSKARKEPKEEDLEKEVQNELYFFYKYGKNTVTKNNQTQKEKTTISLMVGGVIIEEIQTHTNSDIKEFVLEFPSFTHLMENKSDISLTKEVIITLKQILTKIQTNITCKQEKLAVLEILSKTLEHLKSRPTQDSNSGKYNIKKIFKESFVELKKDLEKDGSKVIGADPKLIEALGYRDNIDYVSTDFEKMNFKNIPGVKRLKNIQGEKVPFYTIPFQENSKISYIITNTGILIDEKYLNNEHTKSIINVLVNLNISYELENEGVFYGKIIDGEVVDNSDKKRSNSDENNGNTSDKNNGNILKENNGNILKENNGNILKENNGNILKENNGNITSENTGDDAEKKQIKYVNTTEEIEDFKEILQDYVLDKKDDFENTDFDIEQKSKQIISSEYLQKNDITTHLNKDILTKQTEFFLQSRFGIKESSLVDKELLNKYLNFMENAGDKQKKSLLKFQRFILKIEEKWEYLDMVIDFLEHSNSHINTQVMELIDKLGGNYNIINKIRELKQEVKTEGEENEEDTKIQKNIIISKPSKLFEFYKNSRGSEFLKLLRENSKGNKILDVGNIVQIDGGIAGRCIINKNLKEICIPFKWKDGAELEAIVHDSEGNEILGVGIMQIDGGVAGKCTINKNGKNKLVPFKWKDGKELETITHDSEGNEITEVFNIKQIDGGIAGKCTITKNGTVNRGSFTWINDTFTIYDNKDNIFSVTKTGINSIEDVKEKIGIGAYNFLELLEKGGKFLESRESQIEDIEYSDSFDLSQLIYLNNVELGINEEEFDVDKLKKYFKKIKQKDLDLSIYQRKILSQIDGQDKSSQLWIRESLQNSIDAIRGLSGNIEISRQINIDFTESEGNYVASVFDGVGMSKQEVFEYLLPIGKSGKLGKEGIGKFGQGFYSLFLGAKEVNLKTSNGNGETTYVKIIPVFNKDNLINDFRVSYHIKKEIFRGTLIERIDNSQGIEANMNAMFGTHNIEKYVGCVEGVDIMNNGDKANKVSKVLISQKVEELGKLRLLQNNNIERLTKDGLYMSEIKDKYLDIFPDWIKDIIKSQKLTLDLPKGLDLVSSRTELADNKDLEKLKPYIFNLVTKYILSLAMTSSLKIPMMPEDYFGLEQYERKINNFGNITKLAQKTNSGELLTLSDFELLKDKASMALYLAYIEIENKGEKVSLKKLKENRDKKEYLTKHTGGRMTEKVTQGNNLAREISEDKKELSESEVENNDNLESFRESIFENFGSLFNKLGLNNIKIGFFSGLNPIASAGGNTIRFNTDYLDRLIQDKEKLIEVMTHELTHLLEPEGKWGSHEKDLEHDDSFEKLQRKILETYLRI